MRNVFEIIRSTVLEALSENLDLAEVRMNVFVQNVVDRTCVRA
jgi:uncharacterized alkaline shock family protein YloU